MVKRRGLVSLITVLCLGVAWGASNTTGEVSAMTQLSHAKLRLTRMVVDGVEIPVPEKRPLTLLFRMDGKVSGFGGVNRFHAAAEMTGSKASFGTVASTRMAGSPQLMQLEATYFKALAQVTQFELREGMLVLSDLGKKSMLELVVE